MNIETFYRINRQLQKRETTRINERYSLADLERSILHEYLNDEERDKRTDYYKKWDQHLHQAREKGLEEDRQLWALRKRLDFWNSQYGFSKKKQKAIL